MKIFLCVLGVILTLSFLGVTLFLINSHAEKDAWGWMMFITFICMGGTIEYISGIVKKLP